MHRDSKMLLVSHLASLREHGTLGSMLFMKVQGTSADLLAGVKDGSLMLDYAVAGPFDVLRLWRFKSFCESRRFAVTKEKWGRKRIFRASLGPQPLPAADAIDDCFQVVYGPEGEFTVEYSCVGWLPFNKPLHPTAFGVG